MARCDVCGNDYKMPFQVHMANGDVHTFDSLECANHKLAMNCEHCQVRIVGHGIEVSGRFYCGTHCARTEEGSLAADLRGTLTAQPV
ncbi:hypothetical protein [Salinispora vitiensis]|uniref:hypothetical protein n=1 Tax=Salinispora vitiensis TaxID=999544 RepID=UPI0003A656B8|nr:hypothetical protein [Salinispora vitiensis]